VWGPTRLRLAEVRGSSMGVGAGQCAAELVVVVGFEVRS